MAIVPYNVDKFIDITILSRLKNNQYKHQWSLNDHSVYHGFEF